MKYKVLKITNNIKDYPEAEEDTLKYPELVKYVEDEEDLFIMDERGTWWEADDFFYAHNIKEFETK